MTWRLKKLVRPVVCASQLQLGYCFVLFLLAMVFVYEVIEEIRLYRDYKCILEGPDSNLGVVGDNFQRGISRFYLTIYA